MEIPTTSDKPKRILNSKQVSDNEVKAFAQSDSMSRPIIGNAEGKMEDKSVSASSTDAQSSFSSICDLSESRAQGDRSIDLHEPLVMSPDHNDKRAAAVTNLQEKIKWIQHGLNGRPVLLLER